jgi:HK97 gp10 family phage protein
MLKGNLRQRLKLHPRRIKTAFFKELNIAAVEIANDAETIAKTIVPVDTGELKGSISTKVVKNKNDVTIKLQAEADHAKYVEFGTVKMNAQPFLLPSLKAALIKKGL